MLLYHVSTDVYHDGILTPRVPQTANQYENTTIPRICLSESIEGCLTGIGVEHIQELMELQNGEISILSIDIKNPSKLVPPEVLFKKGYVHDALITKEYWYLDEIIVPKRSIYTVAIRHLDIDTTKDIFGNKYPVVREATLHYIDDYDDDVDVVE